MGNRLTGQESGMAAMRPVLAIAVAGTVAVIGVLALRSPRSDSPVVAGSPLRLLVFADGALAELMRFPSVERRIRAAVHERLPRT